MFKIGKTPSLTASSTDHADFLEFECLRQSDGNASRQDLIAALKRIADADVDGRTVSDERYEAVAEAAFVELSHRHSHSPGGCHAYPFEVSRDGLLLQYTGSSYGYDELYLFLLLATRMNMQADRVQAEINGTELFERVCLEVGKTYWGTKAKGLVFGTARRTAESEVGNFQVAVNDMCARIREGVKFHSHSNFPPAAQDGKLDIVVWKDFADDRQGKLIGFGQCKTGTHWRDHLFDLVPEKFCQKWVHTQPVVPPTRLYFIAARVRADQWYEACVDGGILFDRCRILNYAPEMPELEAEWLKWNRAALDSNNLAIP